MWVVAVRGTDGGVGFSTLPSTTCSVISNRLPAERTALKNVCCVREIRKANWKYIIEAQVTTSYHKLSQVITSYHKLSQVITRC